MSGLFLGEYYDYTFSGLIDWVDNILQNRIKIIFGGSLIYNDPIYLLKNVNLGDLPQRELNCFNIPYADYLDYLIICLWITIGYILINVIVITTNMVGHLNVSNLLLITEGL